ncbi:hypothetical protein GALMADRAFT_246317 [Galerina marginata CBS 339.88]|uniref:Uncharacterized protein n=1 Tax=Galerina marginata (strain CBS 339.88) TaxID=685588 RepID=A0A067T1V8_GALM3|nr:hypothetical protein GALMADRAFT_246317 [Galerina marginata CBS 339.88]
MQTSVRFSIHVFNGSLHVFKTYEEGKGKRSAISVASQVKKITNWQAVGFVGQSDDAGPEETMGEVEVTVDGTLSIEVRRHLSRNTFYPSPEKVYEFLQRNPNHLVEIRLSELSLDVDEPPSLDWQALTNYFTIFLSVLPRWKAVRFWAPYVPWECFQGRTFPAAPALELVQLEGPSNFDIPIVSQIMSGCWIASPSIRTFNMKQFTEDTLPSSIIGNPCGYLPLGCLTAIQMDCQMSVFYCCQILSNVPNLVECCFGNIIGPEAYIDCIFENNTLQTLWNIFEFFRAPALRHVSVSCDSQWRTKSFVQLIRNSGCLLEALELFMIKITDTELHEVLLHTPSLRILNVYGDASQNPQPFTEYLICRLTKSFGNSELLAPGLEMFSVNDDAVDDLPDGMLSKMLLSRMGETYIEKVWYRISRDNPEHQFDIKNLDGIAGQLTILQSVVIDQSVDSWKEWDRDVQKTLQKVPIWRKSMIGGPAGTTMY